MYTVNSNVVVRVEGIDKDGFDTEKRMYRLFFDDSNDRNEKQDIKTQLKKLLGGFRRIDTIDVNMYLGEEYKQIVSKRYIHKGFDGIEFEARTLENGCYEETGIYITKNEMINRLADVFMLMNYEAERA